MLLSRHFSANTKDCQSLVLENIGPLLLFTDDWHKRQFHFIFERPTEYIEQLIQNRLFDRKHRPHWRSLAAKYHMMS